MRGPLINSDARALALLPRAGARGGTGGGPLRQSRGLVEQVDHLWREPRPRRRGGARPRGGRGGSIPRWCVALALRVRAPFRPVVCLSIGVGGVGGDGGVAVGGSRLVGRAWLGLGLGLELGFKLGLGLGLGFAVGGSRLSSTAPAGGRV
eukprot:scaffold18682_cov50-Phaeocystis_antarctica.AAC.1